MNDAEVVQAWLERIVWVKDDIMDPTFTGMSGFLWESVWVGFVIGVGRRDLASAYWRLGEPAMTGWTQINTPMEGMR